MFCYQKDEVKDYLEGAFLGIPVWIVWVYYWILHISDFTFIYYTNDADIYDYLFIYLFQRKFIQ